MDPERGMDVRLDGEFHVHVLSYVNPSFDFEKTKSSDTTHLCHLCDPGDIKGLWRLTIYVNNEAKDLYSVVDLNHLVKILQIQLQM